MRGGFLNRVVEAVTPPAVAGPGSDWAAVEQVLATKLPTDYKELADIYGPGAFDGFLWLLTPSHAAPMVDLLSSQRRLLGALADVVAAGETLPSEVGALDRLLAWGVTDNGDVCYWIRAGDPDSWSVAVNTSRGDDWFTFDGSVSEFLHQVLSGSLAVPIFPLDFPSELPPLFEPLASHQPDDLRAEGREG